MKSILEFCKSTLVGGLIFLLPVVVTIYIVAKALTVAKTIAEPISAQLPLGQLVGIAVVDLIGLTLIMAVCFIAGLVARSRFAKDLVTQAEDRFLWKIPAYGVVKGVTESLDDKLESGVKPVIAKLDDASQIAFEVERLDDGRVVVFLPGSPEAWSGSVMIMTADRIEPLPISVVAAIQNVRSRGRGTVELLAQTG